MTPMQSKALDWLANGEVGISSRTMAMKLAFDQVPMDHSHPYDPDDLDRCLKLLEWVPELRAELPRMASVSRQWAALVANWERVEQSHLAEVGLGWMKARNAPKTYELMKSIGL